MKSVIRFSKIRFVMFLLSAAVIVAGVSFMFIQGFNMGIDFTGGLDMHIQIAPVAFRMDYTGLGIADANMTFGTLTLNITREGESEAHEFPLSQYTRIFDLAAGLRQVEGINVQIADGFQDRSPLDLLSNEKILLNEAALVARIKLQSEADIFAPIDEVRQLVSGPLSEFGNVSIQRLGEPVTQEYALKIQLQQAQNQAEEEINAYSEKVKGALAGLINDTYGQDTLVEKESAYVHSIFSLNLSQDALFSIIAAFILIFIYISFRFKKFIYAFGAIIALVHDVSIMIGATSAFGIEVTSASIAAVLTIIGYSLNDTIVVFDRIRENVSLMPESGMADIIDTSITQSLSRTTITSLTTLLAVATIYIFGTGIIKDFAFNLIIGVVVGTYSSIFIASPIVLGWQRMSQKDRLPKGRTPAPAKSVKTDKPAEAADTQSMHPANVEVVRKQITRTKKRKRK